MNLDVIVAVLHGGVTMLGVIIAVWGIVQVGLGLSSSHGQASGADIAPGVAGIIGGIIIVVGGNLLLSMVDTSWAVI